MKKLLSLSLLLLACTLVFAQGFYIEFKITSSANTGSGTVKNYSQDGNTCSEATINSPQMTNGIKINTLMLKAQPNTIYMLNEKEKTYSEMQTSAGEDYKDHPVAEYEITVLGKETVNGYKTTHVSVKINGVQSQEMWTTKDIAGYADFSKIKTKYTGKYNLYTALAVKGAEGMPVRIKTTQGGRAIQLDLVSAEKRNIPAAMFSLTGYTKGNGLMQIEGMPDMQEMLKKLQNMTPAEKEAMLKKMKEMYSNE